jgi:uncharacterized Rmd1/YagE family protein
VRRIEQGASLALSPLTIRAGQSGCAMIFRNGVLVLFGLEPAEEASFLHHFEPFVTGPFAEPESEAAELAVEPGARERVDKEGVLVLHDLSLTRLQVVAQILAKSAVLSHYEDRVAAAFQHIEPLAETLRRGSAATVRGRELRRRLGDVLLTKAQMVGRFELTEKPEITWERPDLDKLYERLGVEYELAERDAALARKLEVISSTAETLLELDQNRTALRVEWYIVVLIAVEILIYLYDLFRSAS